jgi:hypothetical protein
MTDILERLKALHAATEGALPSLGETIAEFERLQALLKRRTDALHSIGIGGNGERNWTLDEMRAVAWDALEDF